MNGVLGDTTATNEDVAAMLRCYRRFYCAQLGVLHYSWTQQARLEDAAPFGTWDWGFIRVMRLPHRPLFLFPGGVPS